MCNASFDTGAVRLYNLLQEVNVQAIVHPDFDMLVATIDPELLRTLAILPPQRQAEVLDFARFLKQHVEQRPVGPAPIELRPAPADTLLRITGLVALGGDALADSEALYDDNDSH